MKGGGMKKDGINISYKFIFDYLKTTKIILLICVIFFLTVEFCFGGNDLIPKNEQQLNGLDFNKRYNLELVIGGKYFCYDYNFSDLFYGMSVDASHNLYVSSFNYIKKYDSEGYFIRKWGGKGDKTGQFNTPKRVSFDNNGHVYVNDAFNNRVQIFESDGKYITQFGKYGKAKGDIDSAQDIAVDMEGNIYVIGHNQYTIQKFDKNFKYITWWGKVWSEGQGWYRPGFWEFRNDGNLEGRVTVAIDSEGNIVAADGSNNRIQIFSNNGKFLRAFGKCEDERNCEFNNPSDVCVDKYDNVWFISDGKLLVYDKKGNNISNHMRGDVFSNDSSISVSNLALDNNGDFYVSDNSAGRVLKYSQNETQKRDWLMWYADEVDEKLNFGNTLNSAGISSLDAGKKRAEKTIEIIPPYRCAGMDVYKKIPYIVFINARYDGSVRVMNYINNKWRAVGEEYNGNEKIEILHRFNLIDGNAYCLYSNAFDFKAIVLKENKWTNLGKNTISTDFDSYIDSYVSTTTCRAVIVEKNGLDNRTVIVKKLVDLLWENEFILNMPLKDEYELISMKITDKNLYGAFYELNDEKKLTVMEYVNNNWQILGRKAFTCCQAENVNLYIWNGKPLIAYYDEFASRIQVLCYENSRWNILGQKYISETDMHLPILQGDSNSLFVEFVGLNFVKTYLEEYNNGYWQYVPDGRTITDDVSDDVSRYTIPMRVSEGVPYVLMEFNGRQLIYYYIK